MAQDWAPFSRRRFLQASGILAAGAAVAGCNTAPGEGGKEAGGALQWWDHRAPLQDLHESIFKKFAEQSGGMPVEYTYHQTAKLGQALQLAKQSDQMPDVFTNAGLKLPTPALIQDGWLHPLDWDSKVLDRFPPGSLVEGVHTFEDKIYSFPIFTHKQYWAANFFNTELLEKVGLDPSAPPRTYDEFRAACRTIRQKGGDGVYGWIFNLGMAGRVSEQVGYLAQAAGYGAATSNVGGGPEFKTGEYRYDNDAHLAVLEFLLSLQKDKLLVPGSSSMIDKVARARWATGIAGFYFDGPWCPGVVKRDLKQFSDKLGAGPILVPEAGTEVATYKGPAGPAFFAHGGTKHPEAVSKLLTLFCDTDYHRGLAENMAQPPLDPSVIADADVHPAYEELLRLYEGHTFLSPVPAAGNPDVAQVAKEAKPVKPGLGEIVQGLFSGDLTDARKAMRDLSDRANAAHEKAIKAAQKKGAKVSAEDYAFPDWQPRTDYGPEKYKN